MNQERGQEIDGRKLFQRENFHSKKELQKPHAAHLSDCLHTQTPSVCWKLGSRTHKHPYNHIEALESCHTNFQMEWHDYGSTIFTCGQQKPGDVLGERNPKIVRYITLYC